MYCALFLINTVYLLPWPVGEVSLKEVKNTVLLLAKQMVDLTAAMSQWEEIALSSSEYPLGSLPGSEITSWAGREPVGGITPFDPSLKQDNKLRVNCQ